MHVNIHDYETSFPESRLFTLSAEPVKNKSPRATNFRLVTYQAQKIK